MLDRSHKVLGASQKPAHDRPAALGHERGSDLRAMQMRRKARLSNLEALVLEHTQQWRELMQLGHAIGARPLVTHHGHEVPVQLAPVEGIHHFFL